MDGKMTLPISATQARLPDADLALNDFVRIPGVLFRWEIAQILKDSAESVIEHAGKLDDVDVYRVYQRQQPSSHGSEEEIGLAVGLTFEGESTPISARLLPLSDEEPLMAVLSLARSPAETAVLGRIRSYLARSQAPATNATRRPRANADRGPR
jgi:hypothetical protein